jgi:hypothetical protein
MNSDKYDQTNLQLWFDDSDNRVRRPNEMMLRHQRFASERERSSARGKVERLRF